MSALVMLARRIVAEEVDRELVAAEEEIRECIAQLDSVRTFEGHMARESIRALKRMVFGALHAAAWRAKKSAVAVTEEGTIE